MVRSTAPIEIALGDKNPLVLSALSELFERDPRFSLVLTANTAERFLESVLRAPVAIGIVGWLFPKMGGERILEMLRDRPGAPRLVVYSGGLDPELPRRVMAAGGAGFVPKSDPPERLLTTAATVATGQMVFPFLDVRKLRQDPVGALTLRERELLAVLAQGRSNGELARHFGISLNTVKFHLRNLYDKLDVKTRTQAVALFYAQRPDGGG